MIQHERIQALCQELHLLTVADEYPQLVQQASCEQQSYVDFLEQMLGRERMARHARSQSMLRRMAGFPAIKTIEEFDFTQVSGLSKQTIDNLCSLAFVEKSENLILLGASGLGKSHLSWWLTSFGL